MNEMLTSRTVSRTWQGTAFGHQIPFKLLGLAGTVFFAVAATTMGSDILPVGQFYQRYCASCHGVNGKNPRLTRVFPDLPDFTNSRWEAQHTKAELTKSILHGKGAMPAYKGDLRGHTAGELVDYLRTLSNENRAGASQSTSTPDPPRVTAAPHGAPTRSGMGVPKFYQRYCASCHGAQGNNPKLARILPDLPDFTDPNWEATHTKSELTRSILHGKGAMPAYKGDLGKFTPSELIDYLRGFAKPHKSS